MTEKHDLPPLLIRADASTAIGTGHVMRCLALAQAWQRQGGSVLFVMAEVPAPLQARLQSEGMAVQSLSVVPGSDQDAIATAALAQEAGSRWVVVDGYQFGATYQQQLKQTGVSVLFLDDYGHAALYTADLVLNQNLTAHPAWYEPRSTHTRLLLGTQYVLLRQEFWPWRHWQRSLAPVARKILVTLGGSDPDNVTLKVIYALKLLNIPDLDVVVVVGGSNPHWEMLQATVQDCSFPIRLARNVQNMPDLLAAADLAIAAGGTTTWELAFLGLPSLLLMLAENQRAIAEKLDQSGIAINLGWHDQTAVATIAAAIHQLLPDLETRRKMSQLGQQQVDGWGSLRIVSILSGQSIILRAVESADARQLWVWANDPETRQASFSTDSIPWEAHCNWLSRKLQDPHCHFWIALNLDGQPIGQVRFDQTGEQEAVISVSLDRQYQGMGYGRQIIEQAVDQLFRQTSLTTVRALIKLDNQASIRAFEKAGFAQVGQEVVQGQVAWCYVKVQQSTI